MIVVVLIAIAIGVLFGALRGFKRSVVKLSATVLAAGLSFGFAMFAANWSGWEYLISIIFPDVETFYVQVEAISPTLAGLIVPTLPVALIMPLLFLLSYWILKIIFALPCLIINKLCKFKRKNESKAQKRWGIPLGIVQALISVLIFLFVFCGYFNLVDQAMNIVDKIYFEEPDKTLETVSNIVDDISNDPVVALFCDGSGSSNFVFEALTEVEINNKKCSLTKETVTIVDAAVELLPLLESEESSGLLSDKQITALESFMSKAGRSTMLKTIAAEAVSNGGKKWANDEEFVEISFADVDAKVKPILMQLFNIMATTTPETIEDDVAVVVRILQIFNKYEVMEMLQSSDANFMDLLNSGFSKELLELLSVNERFAPIALEIKGLSVAILSSALKAPEVTEEQYNEVSENVADVLNNIRDSENPEEAKEELKNEIFDLANENGIEVSEEIADIFADAFDEIFESHEGEFTKEVVQEYFEEYAAKYGFSDLSEFLPQ